MSRTGQTLVDIPEATVKVLVDRPELVLTYMRSRTEGGPGRHVHREHADGFVVLEGEYSFELGEERAARGAGEAIVIPPRVIHRYEHETTEQAAFLNIHAPGMRFADYLFGERPPEDADNIFDPPEEEGRPASDAITLAFAEDGEVVTDRAERTIRILAALPELCLTWTRYVPGEEGPGPHIHREHVDAFFILSGELDFGLGPDVERVTAGPGTFVLAPPELVHTFRNGGPGEATWLNLHAPSKGFADFLRDDDFVWDSFDPPADGGRPRNEAVLDHVHPA
ncbi:MAG TPA: cupin domain-containing protein [Thermoleophilaceae bacterium]|nr:cupin domain-containing protein [Thermoleophilaceae bacterium]